TESFFFQAEDGIRDGHVTGVQTCALPIFRRDFVQVPTRREHRRLPKCFDPSAARDPLLWLRSIDALFHLGEKIFEVRDAFEIQRSEERRVGKKCRSGWAT